MWYIRQISEMPSFIKIMVPIINLALQEKRFHPALCSYRNFAATQPHHVAPVQVPQFPCKSESEISEDGELNKLPVAAGRESSGPFLL